MIWMWFFNSTIDFWKIRYNKIKLAKLSLFPLFFSIENNQNNMKSVNVTNSWVELILENQLARGWYPRSYKHMTKLTFNPCVTLGS